MRAQRLRNAQQEQRLAERDAARKNDQEWWRKHPGTVESFVPVWGSAREAVADASEGDWVGAGVNGALALTDLTGEGYALKALEKGGLKAVGSHTWGATAKWMRETKRIPAGLQGHHWLIPQNQWGKNVPEWLKNQPWNIKSLPKDVHQRIRSQVRATGEPKFNALERYWHGTPRWWKVQNAIWGAHAAQGAEEGLSTAAGDDR